MRFAKDIATERNELHVTVDGGKTWEKLAMPSWNLAGICATGNKRATVVGDFGTILRTTTGGR